ncbi:XIAP-associated factor 1 isoform X12 [Larus michahellis]|uniref:XIAP-associated factor 1 isoform X12 n=1 Tax=Larus michahellis TaxID=119627 RepID=UPI003D9BE7E3
MGTFENWMPAQNDSFLQNQQVRCHHCHQSMQQYQLEHHETKECHERAMKCKICELEMPFNKLQEHLNTCASRTERCWECNKYIMYKDQNKHKDICQNSRLSYGTGGNFCQKCNKSFPDDQYSQHLNQCGAAHKLTTVLAGQSTSKLSSDPPPSSSSLVPSSCSEKATVWRDVRPKGKERDQPLTSKTLLKPAKKKNIGFPSPTRGRLSTSSQDLKDTQSFDMLVTCAHCNILLPLPTLRKHEIKCLRVTSLKNARMKQKSSHGEKEYSFYSADD